MSLPQGLAIASSAGLIVILAGAFFVFLKPLPLNITRWICSSGMCLVALVTLICGGLSFWHHFLR